MTADYYDILVIGSGGAGLRAALAACYENPDLKVGIVSYGKPGKDGITGSSCSDRMAFHASIDDRDDEYEHARDIFEGGMHVSDSNLANTLARDAKGAFEYLTEIGVPWALDDKGQPERFRTDGSSAARAFYTGPYTAIDISRCLLECARNRWIEFLENHQLAQLKRSKVSARIWDVTLREKESGMLIDIPVSAVIFATGGPGGLFGSRLFHPKSDALPFWCALTNGASLVNLEFIQYGIVSTQTGLACSGTIPRSLPRVVNENDRELLSPSQLEILFRKGASWPVSAESEAFPVDEVIWEAVSGGSKVFLDFTGNPAGLNETVYANIVADEWDDDDPPGYAPTPFERLMEANPRIAGWFMDRGLDISAERVEIKHEVQHFQGGILIDQDASTGVPGLYACGECAGGQHGANRPGGNSLLDCQVMGKIAGENAARYVRELKLQGDIDENTYRKTHIDQHYSLDGDLNPLRVNGRVTEILRDNMGMIKDEFSLRNALEDLGSMIDEGLKADSDRYAKAAATAGLNIAKLFIESALMRRESRGSHLLKDINGKYIPYDKGLDLRWIVSVFDEDGKIVTRITDVP